VDADEFQVATNAWQNGAVDNFANSGPWSYTVADSCTAGSLVGPRPLAKVTDGEDLGSEAGEKDFTGYTPLRFTDSSAPSLGAAANANAAQACTLTFDIKYANASVRAHGSMLIVYLGVASVVHPDWAMLRPCAGVGADFHSESDLILAVATCLIPSTLHAHLQSHLDAQHRCADRAGVRAKVQHCDEGLL
jgi:hypothetical protein